MSPEELIRADPESVSDLIGHAAFIARVQCAKATANTAGVPVQLLLHGKPGCGKSLVCRLLAKHLTPAGTVGRVSGRQVTSDIVREWISDTHYTSSIWIVRVIEEADLIPPDAQALILQYMDVMKTRHALLCTSNASLESLIDRFQSRFQTIPVLAPKAADVADFIKRRWPQIADEADAIAERNHGDVRASLHDAQTHLDVQVYGK